MTRTIVLRQLAVSAIKQVSKFPTFPPGPFATASVQHSEPVTGADRLLSTPELARLWHLSSRTLQRWRALRVGPCWLCLGRTVLYRLADIEDHEASIRTGPDSRGWSAGTTGPTSAALETGQNQSSASKSEGGCCSSHGLTCGFQMV